MVIRIAMAAAVLTLGGVAIAPLAAADPPYAHCSDAAKDGRYNIPRDDPAYSPHLDADHDGVACESH